MRTYWTILDKQPAGAHRLYRLWVLLPLFLLLGSSYVLAQTNQGVMREIRSIYPSEWGAPFPAGLAYATEPQYFFLLNQGVPLSLPMTSTTIAVLTPYEELTATVELAFGMDDAINVVFDDGGKRLYLLNGVRAELAQVQLDETGSLNPATLTTLPIAPWGLRRVEGMAVDAVARQIFILDSGAAQLVTLTLNDETGFPAALDNRIDLTHLAATGWRGLAVHPVTRHLFLANGVTQEVYELTSSGKWLTSYTLAGLDLIDPDGMVFAPSPDTSDPPGVTHLFIADSNRRAEIVSARAPTGKQFYLPLLMQSDHPGAHTTSAVVATQTHAYLYGRVVEAMPVCQECTQFVATAETDPVPHTGDAADDPAIWLHPTDRTLSTIIGTDKLGGLAVYDLTGQQIQYLPDGYINNVDLRYDFPLGDQRVALAAANNRSDKTLVFYRVDPDTRLLSAVAARPIPLATTRLAGVCMYHSLRSGNYYVITNNKLGQVVQWEVFDNGQGLVDATVVRTFDVGVQVEGCVADDWSGHLYIAAEDYGIWKYGAEPDADTTRTLVDTIETVDANGHLTADVEGLALYDIGGGFGYLIASSQGSDEYVVYQRSGSNEYVMTFSIVAANGIDNVSGTDGIDVTSQWLGPAFPQGLFVAQDGNNDDGNQNFKLVPWQVIP